MNPLSINVEFQVFLPSDRNIYKGICGLTLLGSKPSATTISDSRKLRLPPPEDYNSDRILVSQKKLILVLTRLGMIRTSEGENVAAMINKLWKKANEYCSPKENYSGTDAESFDHWHDEIEIGMLKWIMYGVSANQPSWFSKIFCMPCSNVKQNKFVFPEHPASKMNQKSGDLVSHDILTCYLCREATGRFKVAASKVDSSPSNGFETVPSSLLRKETISDDSLGSDKGSAEFEIAQSLVKGRAAGMPP
mmetsp:Transcript_17238/g.31829  ORF Transcript_17238/g.31829 Transcript_17238/m.31829 type:complete len:249 (+) Transcript_17238:172-918(+)